MTTTSRTRLGLLTPSSNTVLEPYVGAVLHDLLPDVTAHFQRFSVQEIALDEAALSQFSNDPIVAAAEMLNHARPDVIAWAGTSGSWRGFELDAALCRAITATTLVPATTSVLAINEILERTGVERIGLVTPYLADVQAAIVANYSVAGRRVVGERHLDDRGNFSFADYDDARVADLIGEVAASGAEAIIVLCTNFRGAMVVEGLEAELGVPIYDSVSATVWKMLSMTGRDPKSVVGWGSLFRELP